MMASSSSGVSSSSSRYAKAPVFFFALVRATYGYCSNVGLGVVLVFSLGAGYGCCIDMRWVVSTPRYVAAAAGGRTVDGQTSLRVVNDPEGPHMIGRESEYCDLIGYMICTFRANSERKCVWSLIGQRTVHLLTTSLIGREAVVGGFSG